MFIFVCTLQMNQISAPWLTSKQFFFFQFKTTPLVHVHKSVKHLNQNVSQILIANLLKFNIIKDTADLEKYLYMDQSHDFSCSRRHSHTVSTDAP